MLPANINGDIRIARLPGSQAPAVTDEQVQSFGALLQLLGELLTTPTELILRRDGMILTLSVRAEALPPAVASLNEAEEAIIEVLRANPKLTGPQIAAMAGYPYDGYLRGILSALRRRGIIENLAPGYRLRS